MVRQSFRRASAWGQDRFPPRGSASHTFLDHDTPACWIADRHPG